MIKLYQRAWLHNSHLGKAKMTEKMMEGIINSDSVTHEAMATAIKIQELARQLYIQLQTRID